MSYLIKARYKGLGYEIVDECDTIETAKYLVHEYSIAFGQDWVVWFEQAY